MRRKMRQRVAHANNRIGDSSGDMLRDVHHVVPDERNGALPMKIPKLLQKSGAGVDRQNALESHISQGNSLETGPGTQVDRQLATRQIQTCQDLALLSCLERPRCSEHPRIVLSQKALVVIDGVAHTLHYGDEAGLGEYPCIPKLNNKMSATFW